ncbi:MAG TPA: ABC transporter ATP-binding protein, partial [bacterium]|nr:ABC transporter ATP-binding protein [bacterium]
HVHAVRSVGLHINEGEICALLGGNGAGKTSTLLALAGIHAPRSGMIKYLGRNTDHLRAPDLVRLGICLVPEGRRVFPQLTVLDNLRAGSIVDRRPGHVQAGLGRVFELFPQLEERVSQLAATLSGGEQQMLAIGRALMASPRLLLLDEPSLGVAPQVTLAIYRTLRRLNREGTTILLVEQNARLAFKVAQRAYILRTGEVALHGETTALAQDDDVRRIYLGVG